MDINWWIVGLTVFIGLCIILFFVVYRLAVTTVPSVTTDISKVKQNIKTGDILVVNYQSKHGRVIRIATQTVWSHIGLAIIIDGKPCIIEVADYNDEYKGLSLIPLEEWIEINSGRHCGYLSSDVPIDTNQLYEIIEPYFDITLDMDLLNWAQTLSWKDNRYLDKSEYFCSEFIAMVLQKIGVLSSKRDPACYSPQKILDEKKHGKLDVFYLD